MAIKIIIHVEGGNVQSVYSSDSNVEVELIDMDNIKTADYENEQKYEEVVKDAKTNISVAKQDMIEIL